MQNNNLRDLTDIETPLNHVKFCEYSQEEVQLAKMILLRQMVRESHRIRTRVTYILAIALLFIVAAVLILFI